MGHTERQRSLSKYSQKRDFAHFILILAIFNILLIVFI
jgi:hypothetical protein